MVGQCSGGYNSTLQYDRVHKAHNILVQIYSAPNAAKYVNGKHIMLDTYLEFLSATLIIQIIICSSKVLANMVNVVIQLLFHFHLHN